MGRAGERSETHRTRGRFPGGAFREKNGDDGRHGDDRLQDGILECSDYRIDIVVTGGGKRLAVECDGEQFHGPDRLQEDLERQAILERLGWRFVRIRGNIFFRDPERAMRPVFQRLEELEIPPDRRIEDSSPTPTGEDQTTEEVLRMAAEIRKQWNPS